MRRKDLSGNKLLTGRLKREYRTLEAMIDLFCRCRHGKALRPCPACKTLLDYAGARLAQCPYGEKKPTCAHCPVHCYKPGMREEIRRVMRFAGPRMLWHHPVLALRHILDGTIKKRKVEAL